MVHEYTLSLALFDYIPVLLSTAALWRLANWLGHKEPQVRNLAFSGALLVVTGGVAKASWKLLLTGFGLNIDFLNQQLFFCLANGFSLLLLAALSSCRARAPNKVLNGVLIALLLAVNAWALNLTLSASPVGVLSLLGLVTVANLGLLSLLATYAYQQKIKWVIPTLVLNVIGTFVLSGLGRLPEQTLQLQWIEELVNTLAQGAMLFAVLTLINGDKLNRAAKPAA